MDGGFVPSFTALLVKYKGWLLASVVATITAQRLAKILSRLYSQPKPVQHRWEENTNQTNISRWLIEWLHWRGTMASLVGAALLVVFIRSFSDKNLPSVDVWTTVFLFCALALGTVLYAEGYLYMKRAVWTGESCAWTKGIFSLWRRWFLVLLGLLTIVCWVLPANFHFSLDTSKKLFSEARITHDLMQVSPNGDLPETAIPQESTFFEVVFGYAYLLGHVVVFVVVGSMMIVSPFILLGFLFHSLGQYKSRGLRGIFVGFFLFWRNLWRKIMGKLIEDQGLRYFAPGTDRQWREGHVYHWGHGASAIIRRGYFHLISEARTNGLVLIKQQTPEETGEKLQELMPEEKTAIGEITGAYHRARYGPSGITRELVTSFESIRWALQKRLKSRKSMDKQEGKER